MRRKLRIAAGCCAGLAAAAAVVLTDLRFVQDERPAPPDLAWLPAPAPASAPRVRSVRPFGEGPCRFEPNLGQSAAGVRFVQRGPACATFLEDAAFTTLVPTGRAGPDAACGFAYRVRFDGATERPPAAAEQRLPGVTNYFVGRDEASWVRGVPNFARVRYGEVWPGIEVVWHGANGVMEYDFVVAPGADSRRIKLAIEGAETCAIDAAGDLVLTGAGTEMRHRRPRIVQQTASGLREVPGAFAMDGPSRVRIDVGAHDPSLALVIDPVIGIRAGGEAYDSSAVIAISKEDLVAIGGQTPSVTFLPSAGALFATGKGMSDAFAVTHGIGTGSPVVGSTAIVGSAGDECFTDAQFAPDGSLFLVGFTTLTSGYPSVRPSQVTNLGGQDGTFVVIDRPGSNLIFSGGIGGTGHDIATSIALAPVLGNTTLAAAFVGVATKSTNVPLAGTPAFPQAPGGSNDAVVFRFTPGGVQAAGTYVGGTADDTSRGFRIALAQDGGVACAFTTTSNLTATAGAFQTTNGGGSLDGFLLHLGPDLSSVTASSFLTGPGADFTVGGIASRPGGGFAICGTQTAGAIPFTLNSRPQVKPGQSDAAVYVLTEALDAAPLVTYAGGAGVDDANGIICTTTGTAFLAGTAFTGRFPVGGGEAQHGVAPDQYVQELDLDDGGLPPFVTNVGSPQAEYGSVYAGNQFAVPVGRPLAVSQTGLVLITGTTDASAQAFPGLVGTVGGGSDVFAQSVTNTSLGLPAISQIDVEMLKVDLTDSTKALKDALHISGSFDPGTTQIVFSPAATGSFALTVSKYLMTGTADVVGIDIPLTDPRWKATKGGDVMTWTSGKGVLPVTKVVVDQARETWKVDLTKLDLPSVGLAAGRFDVDLVLGSAAGSDAEPWTASGASRLLFRPLKPSQIVTGDLVVSPGTVTLGTPFTTTAMLRNRGETPIQRLLRFIHIKFGYQSWTVTIPGRDSLTLEPGTLDISTMVTVPSAGKGQLFRLFLDDVFLDSAKGNVTKP